MVYVCKYWGTDTGIWSLKGVCRVGEWPLRYARDPWVNRLINWKEKYYLESFFNYSILCVGLKLLSSSNLNSRKIIWWRILLCQSSRAMLKPFILNWLLQSLSTGSTAKQSSTGEVIGVLHRKENTIYSRREDIAFGIMISKDLRF